MEDSFSLVLIFVVMDYPMNTLSRKRMPDYGFVAICRWFQESSILFRFAGSSV